jgi:hypothetical protein
MTIVDIAVAYIRAWAQLLDMNKNRSTLWIEYRVAKAIAKKWDEYCHHIFDKSEYWRSHDQLEACLPTGSKLVKTKRKGRVAYCLYSYHYSGDDVLKTLQGLFRC